MSHKKQLFDRTWISSEIESLRVEEPNAYAVDRTVSRVLEHSPRIGTGHDRSLTTWRVAIAACGLVAGGVTFYATLQPANASSLREIASALKKQHTRHTIDSRPDENGNLAFRGELWIDGKKHAEVYDEPHRGISRSGFDGIHQFQMTAQNRGYVDDASSEGSPIEDVDSYLNIPSPKTVSHIAGVELEGKTVDLYKIGFSNVKFDLYVEPSTRLPIRRDVFSTNGHLTEQERYDYPSSIPANTFEPPKTSGLTNYPQLRSKLAVKLKGAGETKEIGGVKITLRAVILGPGKVIALWTGGAKGEDVPGGVMEVENYKTASISARPSSFSLPNQENRNLRSLPPLFVGTEQVLGDAAWLLEGGKNRETYIQGPMTINVPVWAEDRTRPVHGKGDEVIGYHSRLVGRLSFKVSDPIRADEPDRVAWGPTFDEDSTIRATSKP